MYLRDAWGPLPAFLYGWALFLIMATGAIAAVAMTGASYLATLAGWPEAAIRPLAIGLITVLTVLNVVGVRVGATTGNVLTVLKLAAIAVLILAVLLLSPTHAGELSGAVASPAALTPPVGGSAVVLAMGAALVPVLFSYGGWQQTNAVAEELVDPARTLPRALIIGVLVVVAAYMLVNVAYLRALGVDGLAASTAPAADTMFVYLGPAGRTLITFGIVTSTVGFLSMVILMSARVYQAMAADGVFFRSMAALNPRTRTPVAALVGAVGRGPRAAAHRHVRPVARLRGVRRLDLLRFHGGRPVRVSSPRCRRRHDVDGACTAASRQHAGVHRCGHLRRDRVGHVESRQCGARRGTAGARPAGVRLLAARIARCHRRLTTTAMDSTNVGARVTALFVHPIKSAAAIEVDEMHLDDRGAVGDRRWLVVDHTGLQVTARDTPTLALVRPAFAHADPSSARRNVDGALWVDAPRLTRLRIEVPDESDPAVPVQVWSDVIEAHDAGDEAAAWMSEAIRRRCRVVRLAERAHRPLAPKYAGPLPHAGRRVAFTDGAPLLVLGQGSVDALNARLVEQGGEPMSVARFRPNILLSNCRPHEEDTWRSIRLGDVELGVGSPCSRCVMTTIDPLTAEKGAEPLRTLATYRRQDGLVMFGMNATHAAPGVIRTGAVVQGVVAR